LFTSVERGVVEPNFDLVAMSFAIGNASEDPREDTEELIAGHTMMQ